MHRSGCEYAIRAGGNNAVLDTVNAPLADTTVPDTVDDRSEEDQQSVVDTAYASTAEEQQPEAQPVVQDVDHRIKRTGAFVLNDEDAELERSRVRPESGSRPLRTSPRGTRTRVGGHVTCFAVVPGNTQ